MTFASDLSWIEGTLGFEPLEGGFWTLRTDAALPAPLDGDSIVLVGEVGGAGYREGSRVRVYGAPAEEGASIFMAGPLYAVDRAEPAGP